MSKLKWGSEGKRLFETGLDRGVLYLSDGSGVAWNGLIGADSGSEGLSSTPLYYDGLKTYDSVSPGYFSGSIKAVTYPDEFYQFDGYEEADNGLFLDNQGRNTFGLSYRTFIGNDIKGTSFGYKIHILYNLTALPDTVNNHTLSSSLDPIEFSWSITSVPVSFPGFRPTGHVIINSTKMDSSIISQIEDVLYGSVSSNSRQPTIEELLGFFSMMV